VFREKGALYAAYMPMFSEGGIFVPTTRDYKLGEDIYLLLSLPEDPQRYPVAGKVGWLTPANASGGRTQGVGVRFPADEKTRGLRVRIEELLGTTLSSMGYVAQLAGGVAGVWASRFGARSLHVGARLVFAASIYPAFAVITSPESSLAALFAVYMALSALFAMGIVPVYAFLLEAFPKAVRSSGLSILYALGTTIFGGTTQFVVAWLIERTGSPMVPAWYMLATTIAATIGVLGLTPHPEVRANPGLIRSA
jgi:type IV pilus assembly protein PilZ